jgi:LDH2 family malate/lactate/ureidoglycolate dehydrogenase
VAPDGRDASELAPGEVPVEKLALLPLGGPLGAHKGQCLAMMVEILCCLLAGMPFDHELSHFYGTPLDQMRETSHFFLALDVAAFQPIEHFRRRLSALMARVRGESREGVAVLAPGDFETATLRERRGRGVPVSEETLAELRRIDRAAPPAERVGL